MPKKEIERGERKTLRERINQGLTKVADAFDLLGGALIYTIVGIPIGLLLLLVAALVQERSPIVRIVTHLLAIAVITTLIVLLLRYEPKGGGVVDDVCWDSPGGAYRC